MLFQNKVLFACVFCLEEKNIHKCIFLIHIWYIICIKTIKRTRKQRNERKRIIFISYANAKQIRILEYLIFCFWSFESHGIRHRRLMISIYLFKLEEIIYMIFFLKKCFFLSFIYIMALGLSSILFINR